MKNWLLLLLLVMAGHTLASETVKMEKAPVNLHDMASLQRGAKTFVNYCVSCHSASMMRYSHFTKLGFSEKQIKEELMYTTDKIGETMVVAMTTADAKRWLGMPPPDLTLEARARGSDWIYTYLKSFYRDSSRPNGWNNAIFPGAAMPHVLHHFQGIQDKKDGKLVLAEQGELSPQQYDQMVGDLVNFMTYMAEPVRPLREKIGLYVLAFIALFGIFAYLLKREIWKDVH